MAEKPKTQQAAEDKAAEERAATAVEPEPAQDGDAEENPNAIPPETYETENWQETHGVDPREENTGDF